MPDDDSQSGTIAWEVELAEWIQLCWSPTGQLGPEDGPEVRLDLFELLLTHQVRLAERGEKPFPKVQYFAEVVDDTPPPDRGSGTHRFLIEIEADRCRVLPSWGTSSAPDRLVQLETAYRPSP